MRFLNKTLFAALLCLLLFCLTACGGQNGNRFTDSSEPPASHGTQTGSVEEIGKESNNKDNTSKTADLTDSNGDTASKVSPNSSKGISDPQSSGEKGIYPPEASSGDTNANNSLKGSGTASGSTSVNISGDISKSAENGVYLPEVDASSTNADNSDASDSPASNSATVNNSGSSSKSYKNAQSLPKDFVNSAAADDSVRSEDLEDGLSSSVNKNTQSSAGSQSGGTSSENNGNNSYFSDSKDDNKTESESSKEYTDTSGWSSVWK